MNANNYYQKKKNCFKTIPIENITQENCAPIIILYANLN